MNKKYVLDKLAREIACNKKISLRKAESKNLLGEEIINRDDRFDIDCCIGDVGKEKPFYKNPKSFCGDSPEYKIIYFGYLHGKYETGGTYDKPKSIMVYYPSEFIIAENSRKIIRVGRFNDYVSLDIRDKELEKAEMDTKNNSYKDYIRKPPELNEVHCYKRQLEDSNGLSSLEKRLEYAKKFVESLLG